MVPAQPMMDIDPDIKPHHLTKVAVDRENSIILSKSNDMGSSCMDNCEETTNVKEILFDGKTKALKDAEDVEVDIVTCTNMKETITAEAEDPDATEYSSSFADTVSDGGTCLGLSEAEVESQFFGEGDFVSPYDSLSIWFQTRKKKLTDHWRGFIHPLMWRCKWAELKIKEIESQALKYARELAACEQTKQSRICQSTFEGFCSKSVPFSNQCYRRKAIKRRKRKRVEDTTDITSYMSRHSLFSYLENRRSNPDSTSMVDNFGNKVITGQHVDCLDKFSVDDDELFLDFGNGGNSLEQVLWKIEIMHSRVHKLKSQLEMVVSKHGAKFSSSENLSLLATCDAHTSSTPSPTLSAGNGETISVGATYTTNQQISGYDMGDLVMPESAISSYGEAIHVPDIIESTVGLLSAADVTLHRPQIGDSCEDIVDNILIHNEAADREGDTFIGTSNYIIKKHHEPLKVEEGESTNRFPISTSEPDPTAKTTVPQEQSSLKSCLASDFQFPRNKRKRGERKAGSAGWSRKCSGDPDSQ